jgi:hypothetical protein
MEGKEIMFRSLFDHLFSQASNPELKEHIAAARDSANIHTPTADGHAGKAVHGALTWISNIAKDYGENNISDMAREIRDENSNKFDSEW